MDCCQCQGIETHYDRERVAEKLKKYLERGLVKETNLLIDAIKREGIEGYSLLDIGGGVGGVQHELLKAGVVNAMNVEASQAYLEASIEEAKRHGVSDRIRSYHGNFVDIASKLPAADIVTLDRVICCYHDMESMVRLSAARADKLYGVVIPRDTWLVKLGFSLQRLFYNLRSDPFQVFVHPVRDIDALIRASGLRLRYKQKTLIWHVAVYGH